MFSSADKVGQLYTEAQNNLMSAFAMSEETDQTKLAQLAAALRVTRAPGSEEKWTARGLQVIAEQRMQHASQLFSLFTGILDKMNELKQRLISKFSN